MQYTDGEQVGVFEAALEGAAALQGRYPGSRPLASAIEQLRYLVGVAKGEIAAEPAKLAAINIGVIAAKEIEDMDEAVAERIHDASAQARKMAQASA